MRTSVTVENFSRLVTQVYAAGLDWNRWPDFLQAVDLLSGGARCALFGYDMATETPYNVTHTGFAPEFVASYMDYYGKICPWPAALGLVPVGEVRSARGLIPDGDLVRTEFYNDWVRPQDDIACGGGVTLARDTDRVVVFTGNIRRRDSEKLEPDLLRLIGLLTPHLQQALDISRALAGRSFAEMAAGFADHGAAVLVLAGDRSILFANPRAEALIAKGDILGRDLRGRIVLPAAAQGTAGQALAELRSGRVSAPKTFTLTAVPDDRWQCQIAALDPRGEEQSPFGVFCGFAQRCLVLTLAPVPDRGAVDHRMMREFALTAAEAGIVLALADGLSLSEIAAARRVSIHTVRNQVKSALFKTGSRRQSDLVRLVERLRHGGNPH